MRFLLSGGGTAGHAYPALAVAGVLRDAGHDVALAGTPEGMEARLAREAGIDFIEFGSSGWDRSRPWTFVTGVVGMALSTLRALKTLRRTRPEAVLGFGGYVSIPLGSAAAVIGVPLVLHEQNAIPGLANRFLSRWATRVAVTCAGSEAYLRRPERATVTGDPVREGILTATREDGRRSLGLDEGDTVLLVFGGSRGARHINTATIALYERLMAVAGLSVVHVAGRAEAGSVRSALGALPSWDPGRYHVEEYIEEMGGAIAAADLVVARAGATSIAEVTALGRPAVLVPYPYATDDHQTLNARAVENAGAAVVVADSDLDGDVYATELLGLLTDGARRDRMARASASLARPGAARAVADLAVGAARRDRK